MLIETEKMIPITNLQKELTQTVRSVAEEVFERMEIADTIKTRMKKYDVTQNTSWNSIKQE